MFGSLGIDVAPVLRFPIGLLGGVFATLVMDRVMAVRPEGETSPSVAASVLTERRVDAAPDRLAATAHYLAGVGTGLLFVWFSLVAEAALGGPSLVAVAVTTVVLYVLMVGFFAVVPLPRARGLSRTRRRAVLRDWAIAAAGYLLVLVPFVTLVSLLAS